MKIKVYVVDMEIPPRAKRWMLRLGLPLAIILGGLTIAYAAVPKTWIPNEKLLSTDLNANFASLQTQISDIQAQVHAASGFNASLNTPTTIPSATYTTVVFNKVEFDLGGEYSPVTGAFTAKQAGTYLIVCEFYFVSAVVGAVYQSVVRLNGNRVGLTSLSPSNIDDASPVHTMFAQLAANDVVTCQATQSGGGTTATLNTGNGLTHFGVVRLN